MNSLKESLSLREANKQALNTLIRQMISPLMLSKLQKLQILLRIPQNCFMKTYPESLDLLTMENQTRCLLKIGPTKVF